jgi:CcmD family protein
MADRSTQFVATTGGEESTSAEAMLVLAYLAMWLLLFAFVAISFRKLNRLGDRIDSLPSPASKPSEQADDP